MVSCNQAVNSENYADFIYRYGNISLELIRQQTGTDCISYVDEEYVILHAPLDQVLLWRGILIRPFRPFIPS